MSHLKALCKSKETRKKAVHDVEQNSGYGEFHFL